MTCIRFIELLLYFLLLHKVYSEEPEPVFRAESTTIEMGYCFGMDYIVVYRSTPEGDQLIGNSSNKNMPDVPPVDLRGRTDISDDPDLLGFQIHNLTHLDSGIYRRECWKNQRIITQKTQQLIVCKEEIKSELINVNNDGGETELLCMSRAIGLDRTSVRWYYEMLPSYEPTLFLDTSVSMKPLVEELPGFEAVRDNGALLVFNNMLKKTTYFKCLVIKENCISFQNIYPPDDSESRELFVSLGDRVVLNCPADDSDQAWQTPLGRIDGNSTRDNQMYTSEDDFSLVIPAVLNGHIGEYSCISTLREIQYLLILCPNNKPQEKDVDEGETVSLTCDFGHFLDDPERVHWHRYGLSGQYEIIHDSQDENIPIPEDLQGRVTLSEDGTSLTITNLKMKDGGTYGCAAFKSPYLPVNYSEYNDYDESIGGEEDEKTNDYYWTESSECIFKREIVLKLLNTTRNKPIAVNATVVVAAVLVGLLVVVGAIVTVVVVKKRARARASPTHGEMTPNVERDVY